MSRAVKSFASTAAIVLFTIDAVAQAPATPKQAARKGTAAQKTKELSTQIESLQSKLDQAQTEIQQQNVQIEQLQQSLQGIVNALQQQQQRQQLQASVQGPTNRHSWHAIRRHTWAQRSPRSRIP